ncbi:MAG: S-methyl-5-thioribose-1-phosphate isomerase [Candidatus Helarchaeota archaeon]
MKTIKYSNGLVEILDQTILPHKANYITCRNYEEIARCIEVMNIRGAPAIGVAAAFGLALTAYHMKGKNVDDFKKVMQKAADRLAKTRPTAINLFWAINRIMEIVRQPRTIQELRKKVMEEALRIAQEDYEINRAIGENGAVLIQNNFNILTHCNAGELATSGEYGTALAVIKVAFEQGKKIHVYADETRPRLQGARLTAFELHENNIPVTVISDNMAGTLFAQGKINCVIVGADRILKTGHVTNKIGTYSVAILAKYHNVPFYVAAPKSSFDLETTPNNIIIEERSSREVTHIGDYQITPKGVPVINPAFDITPPELVTAIITEKGIIRPPYNETIIKTLNK